MLTIGYCPSLKSITIPKMYKNTINQLITNEQNSKVNRVKLEIKYI